jgi:thiamine biosynthesis lipoprotein
VRFSLNVAHASGGIFDPTVGARQAKRGFNRNYATGQHVQAPPSDETASYRDVILDERAQTIELRKPLMLDLGAVAKGLAVDLAARQLMDLGSFAVNAGGDIYASGLNELGQPWRVGIEHPRADGLICTIALRGTSVCTSGDYERPAADPGEHHLLDPRSGHSPRGAISCSVVAPSAMVADALSTAAFIAGPEAGLRLLKEQDVDGLVVSPDLSMMTTSQFGRWLA